MLYFQPLPCHNVIFQFTYPIRCYDVHIVILLYKSVVINVFLTYEACICQLSILYFEIRHQLEKAPVQLCMSLIAMVIKIKCYVIIQNSVQYDRIEFKYKLQKLIILVFHQLLVLFQHVRSFVTRVPVCESMPIVDLVTLLKAN